MIKKKMKQAVNGSDFEATKTMDPIIGTFEQSPVFYK